MKIALPAVSAFLALSVTSAQWTQGRKAKGGS
jgi:hypothetical protein